MHSSEQWQTLFVNVNLATMSSSDNSYGVIENGALAIAQGKIAWLGAASDLPEYDPTVVDVVDGQGKWLTPGLIDCHTHIIYGGNRANEFEMRLMGKSYEEIAKAGGGILSTVAATRSASEMDLFNSALKRLKALHEQGVTTIEIKSGYGLDTDNEIKMLKVAGQLATAMPITVSRTFLGAHALPAEYKENSQAYIEMVCNEMIPKVASMQLADAVDVFCEGIGFSLEETEQVFVAAKKQQLAIKVHAEQLSNLGGSALAAKHQALSSDHVEYLDEAGVEAMANAGMCAVLLPGAYYFLRETQLPPIELLRKYRVPLAIATDANPGSSPLNSIQLMLNMACTLFRLTPAEALSGVTRHAAKALGLADQKGQLQVGFDADIALWDISQPAELCYQFGVNPLVALYHQGSKAI
ncbi:imidazolonepropionase [Thalassotalea ganghwensis]